MKERERERVKDNRNKIKIYRDKGEKNNISKVERGYR